MAKLNSTIFKQETIKSWFTGVSASVNNEVIQPFQNASSVIDKYNQAIQHNSLTQQGWERLLAQSDDSLKAYLTSVKGSTASMRAYNVSLQGSVTGFSKIASAIQQYNTLGAISKKEQQEFATAVGLTNNKLGSYLTGLNGSNASLVERYGKNGVAFNETAILRMANDKYRKAIFNAQVYANTGAGTYEKAVDMATKDMLTSGLNCVEYVNGARHTLKDYADMAIRTASKRAYLQGEGVKRQEWGISTVIMNKRGNPCPKCLPFCGKVLVDDVWSGGRSDGIDSETGKKYPTMSYAISQGLYHPRCKDSHTTYFPGISTADDTWTKKELEDIGLQAKQEARQQYTERQAEKFERLAKYSLDEENKKLYESRAGQWRNVRFKTGGLDSRSYAESKRPLANFRALPQEQVVNVLRKESEEWISTLSREECKAIRKYTYNSGDKKPNRFFERLNAMLRGDLPEDEKLREYAETISKALKKNQLKHDVIAYRGVNIDPLPEAMAGDIVKPEQFYSTSIVEKKAFGAKYQLEIYVKKGAKAAYIEKLSYFSSQKELLIDKDCIYRVLSRKGNKIRLEVI